MRFIMLLFLFSCADIFIPEDSDYKSIHLNQGGWIHIANQNYPEENGLKVINNDFTLEIYFSGDINNSNTAGAIFSIIDDDNSFIILGAYDDPSINNVLSFYVNDNEQEVIFDGMDFTNSDEFHLLQVLSEGDSIKFYLDNNIAYSVEDDIAIDESDLVIGAKGNSNFVDKIWGGYIDEVRLWSGSLSDESRKLHFDYPGKLIESMQDSSICNLVGLWSFNYPEETYEIEDEKCVEANNLYYGVCNFNMCDYPLDGLLYTLPEGEVRFSRKKF